MNQPIETEGTTVPSDSPKIGRSRYRYRTAAMVAIVLVAVLASAVSAYSTNSTMVVGSKPAQAIPMQNVSATVSQSIGGSVTVSVGSSSQSQQATEQMSTQTTPMTSTTQVVTSSMQTSSTVSQTQAATTSVTQTVATTTVMPQDCSIYGCYPYPAYPYAPYPPGYPAYPGYYPGYSPGYYNGYSSVYGGCSYAISTSPNNNAVQCYGYVYQAPNGCVELEVGANNAPYYGGTALQYYTLHNLSSTPASGTWVRVQGLMYQGANTSPTGAGCPGNYINVSAITTL